MLILMDNAEVTLVNEAQARIDDNLMFDTGVFDEQEVEVEKAVSTAEVTTISATTTTVDELTMAQTLIKIKAAKPKAVTTATTTTIIVVTRPKARVVVVQEPKQSYDEIQEMFDKEMKRVNTFIDMDKELVKGNEHVEAKGDDDQEEAEMKKHMKIIQYNEVEIDAIPLATKPLVIVEWKTIKEGKMGYFLLIRVDGSSKRYSSMIQMLQNIDRKDLETLSKLVKAKHRNTRPEEAYEIVLWGRSKISAAYTKVNDVGMKVTTAERLQLLEEFLLSEG
ncbi:hypothetical protein Tco_0396348 [Tanacetum coccineum]